MSVSCKRQQQGTFASREHFLSVLTFQILFHGAIANRLQYLPTTIVIDYVTLKF